MKAIRPVWHGIDTAKVGYNVHWTDAFQKQLDQFEKLRNLARLAERQDGCISHALTPGGPEYVVWTTGSRMLPYAFERGGIVLFFSATSTMWVHDGCVTPNLRAEFSPRAVACNGLAAVHRMVLDLIAAMGGHCTENQLSEVHMTCDVETDRPHDLTDYYSAVDHPWDRVCTRIRTNGATSAPEEADARAEGNRRHLKYIHIGRDKKMLRIYDKMLELQAHPDKQFEAALWSSRIHDSYIRSNGMTERPATAIMRVEFQLRREAIRELGIRPVEHFLLSLGYIWQKLTTESVRMIDLDDENRTRCSTQQWWRVVQDAWTSEPNAAPTPPEDMALPAFRKYADQTMGLLTSAAAYLPESETQLLTAVLLKLENHWRQSHDKSWKEIMQNKRTQLNIRRAKLGG